MRQEGWRGNSLACGGSIGPGELSLELPGHEAPEGFQRTPLEDANHLIARPCRVCFTVPGLPADHPDVLRPAELGGLPDPRHGVGGAGLVRQNNNNAAFAQSESHDFIPCHDGKLLTRSSHCPCNKPLLHQSVKKGEPPAPRRTTRPEVCANGTRRPDEQGPTSTARRGDFRPASRVSAEILPSKNGAFRCLLPCLRSERQNAMTPADHSGILHGFDTRQSTLSSAMPVGSGLKAMWHAFCKAKSCKSTEPFWPAGLQTSPPPQP